MAKARNFKLDLRVQASAAQLTGALAVPADTATSGSYFNATTANETIGDGWQRDPVEANPHGGGMRALGFVHGASGRGLVVFRGTDLGPSKPSSTADSCADSLLFDGSTRAQLPASCAAFPPVVLDYLQAARAFAAAFKARHAGIETLFTGHSLGAGLAVLVAAADPDAVAVVFSSPAVADLMWSRLGRTAAALQVGRRVVYLANEFDPIFHEARQLQGLPGRVCVWGARADTPAECRACFRDQPAFLHRNTVACAACFEKQHIFANYYYTLLPGKRPQCGAPSAGSSFPRPQLRAPRGRAPTIDGVWSEGEWSDAASILTLAPPTVAEFSAVESAADFALLEAWAKFDDSALYLGFVIADDVAYGVDTPSWQPAVNPEARLLNRSGFPWFGDEMEVLLDAQPQLGAHPAAAGDDVVGNASRWGSPHRLCSPSLCRNTRPRPEGANDQALPTKRAAGSEPGRVLCPRPRNGRWW